MKRIIKPLGALFIITFAIILFMALSIYKFGFKGKVEKADVVIVLGCMVYGENPSPFLRARTEEGIRLYKEGYVKKLIFSGGMGDGESITEAEAMKRIALKMGVKEDDIILEDSSSNTRSNLKNSKEIMDKYNFERAIIVSNKYHLKRASLYAKEWDIKASYSGVFLKQYKGYEYAGFIREIPGIIKYYIEKIWPVKQAFLYTINYEKFN